MPNFKLIRRAKKELAQDGAIAADTFMMLMNAGIDPTMITEN